MNKVNEELRNELSRTNHLTERIEKVSNEVVDSLRTEVEKSSERTDDLFAGMEELNETRQEEFIGSLSEHIETYRDEIADIIETGEKKIADKLSDTMLLFTAEPQRCHVRSAHIDGIQNMPKGMFCIDFSRFCMAACRCNSAHWLGAEL